MYLKKTTQKDWSVSRSHIVICVLSLHLLGYNWQFILCFGQFMQGVRVCSLILILSKDR